MAIPLDPLPSSGEPTPPAPELEYGEEVLCAGWNPDVEQLARARARQPDESGDPGKHR